MITTVTGTDQALRVTVHPHELMLLITQFEFGDDVEEAHVRVAAACEVRGVAACCVVCVCVCVCVCACV